MDLDRDQLVPSPRIIDGGQSLIAQTQDLSRLCPRLDRHLDIPLEGRHDHLATEDRLVDRQE